MEDKMEFPDTWEEFAEDYGFFDNQGVYTNGSLLIPEFRVRQWLEHISCVDAVSREKVVEWLENATDDSIEHAIDSNLEFIPPVEPTRVIATIHFDEEKLKEIALNAADKFWHKWIRTKERMPKPNQYKDGVAVHYLVETEYSDIYVAMWDGEHWRSTIHPLEVIEDKIVAWMPTPEKYMGEEVL